MTTPAALRALATRVETEAESDALNEDVARAFGWKYEPGEMVPWVCPDYAHDYRANPPDFLTSLDAAVSLMPEGWLIIAMGQSADGIFDVMAANIVRTARGTAPTEPRARVSAALRARAAEMEARDGE